MFAMFVYIYIGTNISKNELTCILFYIFQLIFVLLLLLLLSLKSHKITNLLYYS